MGSLPPFPLMDELSLSRNARHGTSAKPTFSPARANICTPCIPLSQPPLPHQEWSSDLASYWHGKDVLRQSQLVLRRNASSITLLQPELEGTSGPSKRPAPPELDAERTHLHDPKRAHVVRVVREDHTGPGDVQEHKPAHPGQSTAPYECTCGNKYKESRVLKRHLKSSRVTDTFECSKCHQSFPRKDTCQRHVTNVCNNEKPTCPGCQTPMRQDYLRQHLDKNQECRLLAEIISAGNIPMPQYCSWGPRDQGVDAAACASTGATGSNDVIPHAASAVTEKRSECTRPVVRASCEACNICGNAFEHDDALLKSHLWRHLEELQSRPFECKECQISFAFQGDYERHNFAARGVSGAASAAPNVSCGWNFIHSWHGTCNGAQGKKSCSSNNGHHPPNGDNHANHCRMRIILSEWEDWQLTAHRRTIERLSDERRLYVQEAHKSFFGANFLYQSGSSLRFSNISIPTFHSLPANAYFGLETVDELAATFDLMNMDTEAYTKALAAQAATAQSPTYSQVLEPVMLPQVACTQAAVPAKSARFPIALAEQLQTQLLRQALIVRPRLPHTVKRYLSSLLTKKSRYI